MTNLTLEVIWTIPMFNEHQNKYKTFCKTYTLVWKIFSCDEPCHWGIHFLRFECSAEYRTLEEYKYDILVILFPRKPLFTERFC